MQGTGALRLQIVRNWKQIRNRQDTTLPNLLVMPILNVFEFEFRVCFELRISSFEFWGPASLDRATCDYKRLAINPAFRRFIKNTSRSI